MKRKYFLGPVIIIFILFSINSGILSISAEKEFNVYVEVVDKNNSENNFFGFYNSVNEENISVQMKELGASSNSGFGEFASLRVFDNIFLDEFFIVFLLFIFIILVIMFRIKKKSVNRKRNKIKKIR